MDLPPVAQHLWAVTWHLLVGVGVGVGVGSRRRDRIFAEVATKGGWAKRSRIGGLLGPRGRLLGKDSSRAQLEGVEGVLECHMIEKSGGAGNLLM